MALAVGFAVALNLVLLATVAWTGLLSPFWKQCGWAAVGLVWGVSAVASLRNAGRSSDGAERLGSGGLTDDLFRAIQSEYLKGNWYETEELLGRHLRQNAADADARLMLATLMRHTGRHDEARSQLKRLLRLDGCEKWRPEIEREFDLLLDAAGTGRVTARD